MLVTRIVLASITIAGALLVVVMAVVLGPAAALSSLAIAVLTPYVWVPLLISLVAFGLHRELRGPTRPGRDPAVDGARSEVIRRYHRAGGFEPPAPRAAGRRS